MSRADASPAQETQVHRNVLGHMLREARALITECREAAGAFETTGRQAKTALQASEAALAVSEWVLSQMHAMEEDGPPPRLRPMAAPPDSEVIATHFALTIRGARLYHRADRLDRLMRGESENAAPPQKAPAGALRLVINND